MSVDAIEIERSDKEIRLIIKTAKPGLIIGRSGEGITNLKKELDLFLRSQKMSAKLGLKIDIEEIRSPESSARIVGQMIAEGLEKRGRPRSRRWTRPATAGDGDGSVCGPRRHRRRR